MDLLQKYIPIYSFHNKMELIVKWEMAVLLLWANETPDKIYLF